MENPLKKLMLPPAAFRDLKMRLLLLLVFGASVALAWWSINRLAVWEKKLQVQNTKVVEIENETGEFERRWNPQEAERIFTRSKQCQEQLLAGHDEVLGWQADLKRRADQFTLSVNAGITKTQDCPLPGKRFSIYSATLDVGSITPGVRTNSPYLRVLNFARDLASEKKRVDVVELEARGSSNSVNQARLGLQLWSLENLP
ncbi:MAG TPA: hypothetical protein VEO53_14230 [Candidatus Binatia bacterium]|nr:hypothetical protein [Candidatus Binatia bacterium]